MVLGLQPLPQELEQGAGKTTGQGQAEISNPDQSPKGTEWQAVSGSGKAERSIIQGGVTRFRNGSQGQGRQNGQTRKQELETDRSRGKNAGWLDKQNKLATDKQITQV